MANTKITADVIEANAVLAVSIADENITSAKLADLAVTEGKIANSAITAGKIATDAVITAKIQNGAITSAKLDTNIAIAGTLGVTGDITGTLATAAQPNITSVGTITGLTTTGDINFGDNDKAVFGAGSDLQIYHDGSYSWIKDAGTGSLIVAATNLSLQNAAATKAYANFNDGGSSTIHYDGSAKLATTSTGIDVTGTATMDGLTVEGSSTGTLNVVNFLNTNNISANQTANRLGLGISNTSGANYTYIEAKETGVDDFAEMNFYTGVTATKRMTLGTYGDISFYDDTGTTAKFFWDASAESLNVGGNTNYNYGINVGDSGFGINSTGVAQLVMRGTEFRLQGVNAYPMTFYTANTERLRIDSSGGLITKPAAGGHAVFNENGVDADFRVESDTISSALFVDGASGNVSIGSSTAYGTSKLTLFAATNPTTASSSAIQLSIGEASQNSSYSLKVGYIFIGGGYVGSIQSIAGGNPSTLLVNADGGNVLVGATSNASNQRLHVESAGTYGQIGLRNSGATAGKYWNVGAQSNNTFLIYNNGVAGVYLTDGATSWAGSSDENLKENIVELTGVLGKVKDFRCVEYNLISDETNSKKIGFIAQDWQEDYSQVVSQDENGNLGMQYTETIPVLLKAIQEQQALIESLTTRLETLENA